MSNPIDISNILSISDSTLYILIGIGVLLLLQIISNAIKFVPQSENWTVQRFGRFKKTLNPGINFIFPFLDRVATRISMREQVLDVPPQYIITADNATVTVDAVIFFKIFDAYKASYEVADLLSATEKLGITSIRTVMGAMELDKLLSNREIINARLLEILDEATDPWGVEVIRTEIKDITPPEDIQQAMNNQMKAERNKRVETLRAEADQKAAALRADGESKALVLKAQAAKSAEILAAEAQKEKEFYKAEARERAAAAEAKAIATVSNAIKKGRIESTQYFLGKSYIESLKKVGSAPNSKVLFMPFEAANFMSTVGSLTDLAKTMMQSSNSPNKTHTEKNIAETHKDQNFKEKDSPPLKF